VTGTNFQYLVATAQVESKFNPSAQAPSSSARGLFQFIEQTWLATLKEQGPALGYAQIAAAIERAPSGQYVVANPRLSDRIMKLRNDPTVNAVMAGAYTRANAGNLAGRLGRDPTEGELYIAHFLGSNGASRLISLAESKPRMRADDVFPGAARANPSIFYDRRGHARSVADVYHVLTNRYVAARGDQAPSATQLAAAPAPPQTSAVNSNTPPSRMAFAPDTAELTQAYATASRMSEPPKMADTAPVFHGLFRTSAGREAVAPVVSALWTAPTPVADAGPQEAKQHVAAPGEGAGTLSLFQDQPADPRALFRGRV
jgi:hypothetical protein